ARVDDAWIGNEPRRVLTPVTTPAREITRVVRHPPWSVKMSLRGGVDLTSTPRTIPSHGAVEALMARAFSARPQTTGRRVAQRGAALAATLLVAWLAMRMGYRGSLCVV